MVGGKVYADISFFKDMQVKFLNGLLQELQEVAKVFNWDSPFHKYLPKSEIQMQGFFETGDIFEHQIKSIAEYSNTNMNIQNSE